MPFARHLREAACSFSSTMALFIGKGMTIQLIPSLKTDTAFLYEILERYKRFTLFSMASKWCALASRRHHPNNRGTKEAMRSMLSLS